MIPCGVANTTADLAGGGAKRVYLGQRRLTEAIALYLARASGRHYEALFCDEVDGALDSECTRMFMQMKREVLRLGGYSREFFVSQTPQLTPMADGVIDLVGPARSRDTRRRHENGCIIDTFG